MYLTIFVLAPLQQEGASPIRPKSRTKRLPTSSSQRLVTFYPHPSRRWCCHLQYSNQFAKSKHQPSSSQPQSVDTANYARVNQLPSPATSSSSPGELHLYIDSDKSLPSVPVGPQSSSQELLLQGDNQVPQPPPLFSAAHTAVSTSQSPPQPTSIPSWADEVATTEHSGRSTPETVVPNGAYSGRIRRSPPPSQPLVYSPPVMPTPHTQRPPVPSPPNGPTIPPLRPQPSFPQPPTSDRPTSTDNYSCNDPSLRTRPWATENEIYPVRSSPIQASQLPARHTASPSRGPQPSSSCVRGSPLKSHKDQTSVFTNSSIPSVLIPSKDFTCRSELNIHPLHLNTHSNPQQVPALLDNWRRDGTGTFH